MTTGERIRKRRKDLGISAEKLANMLNVSPSTIYRYENGYIEKCPSYILEPIAEFLFTTPAYLMGWDEAPAPASSEDLSEEALQIAHAFDAATDREKEMVRLTLDPYMGSPLGRSDKVV